MTPKNEGFWTPPSLQNSNVESEYEGASDSEDTRPRRGWKKVAGFPWLWEFSASVGYLFVQPDTAHPLDREGLGMLWFAPKMAEIRVREKIESYGGKPAKKQVSWNDVFFGINSEF